MANELLIVGVVLFGGGLGLFFYGMYDGIMAWPEEGPAQACALDSTCDLYKYDHNAAYRESRGGQKNEPGTVMALLGIIACAIGIYPLSRGLRIRELERRP